MRKAEEKTNELDPKKEFLSLLSKVEIYDEKEIEECLDLLAKRNYTALKKSPEKRFRSFFSESLDKLIEKN